MKAINKSLSTIVILVLLTSCSLFDSGGETMKGRYNICWIDTKANRSINYASEDGDYGGSTKIVAFVRRMGHNERFILAERIYFDPFKQMSKPDCDSVTYYIIDMKKEAPYDEKDVMGPFNEARFERAKIELGISNLKFTNEYYDY